jgi:hypothetical protein
MDAVIFGIVTERLAVLRVDQRKGMRQLWLIH